VRQKSGKWVTVVMKKSPRKKDVSCGIEKNAALEERHTVQKPKDVLSKKGEVYITKPMRRAYNRKTSTTSLKPPSQDVKKRLVYPDPLP